MDRKLTALLGTAAAAAAATCLQPAPAMAATSFSDLLEPVANAVEALKADDARLADNQPAEGTQLAQVFYDHHHHHHHHNHWRRFIPVPRYYHHHHHHGYFRLYHHHHHHHHHHRYYRDDR